MVDDEAAHRDHGPAIPPGSVRRSRRRRPTIRESGRSASRWCTVRRPVLVSAPGELSAEAGRAAYEPLCRAVKDAQAGVVAAVATAPVNKLAFARAGLPWKGHTDLLAHLTGSSRVAMMFWSEPLKVVLATIHIPLASVASALTRERHRRNHRPLVARAASLRHSRSRGSRLPDSIPTPAKTACSATRSARSCVRRSRRHRSEAFASTGRSRETRCSDERCAASSTP